MWGVAVSAKLGHPLPGPATHRCWDRGLKGKTVPEQALGLRMLLDSEKNRHYMSITSFIAGSKAQRGKALLKVTQPVEVTQPALELSYQPGFLTSFPGSSFPSTSPSYCLQFRGLPCSLCSSLSTRHKRKRGAFSGRQTWVCILAEPPIGCLALGKLSELHLSHLKNGDNNTHLGGLSED